jgi:TonB family protein
MPEVSDPLIAETNSEGTGLPETLTAELRLLIETEPWSRAFRHNLRDLLVDKQGELPPLRLQSGPGAFWPDVFVERKLPWRRFFESGGYHVLAVIAIVAGSRFLSMQPRAIPQFTFTHADVVYYSASEYLPPLDTLRSASRRPHGRQAMKADPGLSAQPIISLPREADNHSQTVVAAPRIQLKHEVRMPNTVAWSDTPRIPIAPAPLVPASEVSRLAPRMERSVVAPPPSVEKSDRQTMQAPQMAVVAPPPALDAASNRRIGDMNIGHSAVIAPAPQLSVAEQRTMPQAGAALRRKGSQVIAPPPSLGASGRSRSGGAVVALSLNPSVGAPPAATGNRRGSFSSGPSGHRGASGATADSDTSGTSSGNPGKNNSKLPSGLYVGNNSGGNTVNPNLIANAGAPRVARTEQSASLSNISEAERQVFGDRKIYSLSLNMPNLNSGGGSWIIRFAPLEQQPGQTQELVSSPVATRKVDPAYPLELMRQNVQGTVILYAVIHADGTVSDVRVLRSVDERLDRFAGEAISKWKFQPAMKAGSPVDVEATFRIPFRPGKAQSDF